MTVDDAAERLCRLLIDLGFDAVRPCPALAWEAFKRFAVEPYDVRTTEVWFEAGEGDPDSGHPAYFDFVRVFTHDPDEGEAWGEQVTAHFTAWPTVRLGFDGSSIQANEVSDLSSWFKAVEASSSFRAGLAFKGWSFEVRCDGC